MTRIDEIADHIYRISTPVPPNPGLPAGFTFNQFLVVDDEPLLFHTGMQRSFAAVRDAVATVIPIEALRWVSYSHHEADESGALAAWLAAAPHARPLVGALGAAINASDIGDPRALADGEVISLGTKRVRWHDTPHLPHGWDAGMLFELTTRTLFCSDLLTQAGDAHPPVTEHDLIGPAIAMRAAMDYYSNPTAAAGQLERLAATEPALLACMHGAAFRGDGAAALRELARTLSASL